MSVPSLGAARLGRGVEVDYRPPTLLAPKYDRPAPDVFAATQVERGNRNASVALHPEIVGLDARACPPLAH